MQENLGGGCGNGPGIKNCGNSGAAGANCYGYKSSRNDTSKIPTPLSFSSKTNAAVWSQSNLSHCHVNEKTLLNEQLDQSVEFNIFGRYVRVLAAASKGDGFFHLSQVMVYDLNGTNIAVGKTASAISTSTQHGVDPSIAIDNQTTMPRDSKPGIWHNNSNSRTDWWQVDLGSVQMITNVRVVSRGDCCFNRIEGVRIRVLKTTDETATDGTCTLPPTPIYPAGTTDTEKIKIGDMIINGIDGQKALNVLRGIQASTATSLTVHGLTDSQAAAAYNKLYLETLNIRRSGWQFTASWTPGTPTLTVTNGIPPSVNMTIKTARGIPIGATVIAVSGNTITLNRPTDVATGYGKYILPTGAVDQTIQTKGYNGRYVRLRPSLVSGDGFVQVSQVVIKDASGTNIARGKPVFTTSVYCNGGSCFQQGSATVDGVLTPRAGSGAWQPMTGNRTTEYMEVDLGSVVAISSIQVQGRPDCCNGIHGNDRMTGMRIEINQTARAADTAAPTIANQPVAMNGDINDTTYFSLANAIRSVTTVASIQYDKAATLADYMKFNKGDIQVPDLDSTGNPVLEPVLDSTGKPVPVTVLDSAGNPISNQARTQKFKKIPDNGETAATTIIMSVTKLKAVDPNASASSATKATTTGDPDINYPGGVPGYDLPAPPNTTDWSANSLKNIPQQTAAINLGDQAPIEVKDPTTSDAEIKDLMRGKNSFESNPSIVDPAVMEGAAEKVMSSARYTAPSQSESGVAGVTGAQKEVFWIGRQNWYSFTSRAEANQACVDAGADGLATNAQLLAAQQAGAQWCAYGWLKDTGNRKYPMQENGVSGCGSAGINDGGTSGAAGANCFGLKPSANDGLIKTLPNGTASQTVRVNKKGRYVRLRPSKTADGYMNFLRIVVKNKSGENISRGKSTYATSSATDSAASSVVLLDENTNLWKSGKPIVVNLKNPTTPVVAKVTTPIIQDYDEEYFEIDLGSMQEIGTIDYYGRTDSTDRIRGTRIEVAKSPRPRPFSTKPKSEAWNQISKINTAACARTPQGVQTEQRTCGTQILCVDPANPNCAQGCPPGSSKGANGRCGGTAPTLSAIRLEDSQMWQELTTDERNAYAAELNASKTMVGNKRRCDLACENKEQELKLRALTVLRQRNKIPPRDPSATPEDFEQWVMLTQADRNELTAKVTATMIGNDCPNSCKDMKQEIKVIALNRLRARREIPPKQPSARIEPYEAWMLLTQRERTDLYTEITVTEMVRYTLQMVPVRMCEARCKVKMEEIKQRVYTILQARRVAIR
jgi:hypothetical protein